MTVVASPSSAAPTLPDVQHLVLEDVSWEFYEHLLRETGSRPLRITFDDGRLEVMSPLPEHEAAKKAAARLVELLAFVRGIPLASFGSTTFRRRDRRKGLEPDECYYVADAARVAGMKEFDPRRDPPPEFVIEIDLTSRSVEREPIYAALGVREIWRYDRDGLRVLELGTDGTYRARERSTVFPFLPIPELSRYIERMTREPDVHHVLNQFADWARAL